MNIYSRDQINYYNDIFKQLFVASAPDNLKPHIQEHLNNPNHQGPGRSSIDLLNLMNAFFCAEKAPIKYEALQARAINVIQFYAANH